MAEEIGGYFARLRLIVDQDDFNTGVRTLAAMEYEIKQTSDKSNTAKSNWSSFVQGLAASIYTIKQVSAAIKDMYQALDQTNKVTTKAMGVGAEWNMPGTAVQKVGAAAQIAGANPQSVISSMTALIERMGRVNYGELNKDEVLAFKFLGLDWTKERGKKAPDLLQDILSAYLKISPEHRPEAASSVEKIAGMDVKDMANFLAAYGMTAAQLFSKAGGLTVTTAESNKGAMNWTEASNSLKTLIDSLKAWFGGEVGAKLAPLLNDLTDFLSEHLPEIEAALLSFIDIIGGISSLTFSVLETPLLNKSIGELTKERSDALIAYRKAHGMGVLETNFKPMTIKEYGELIKNPSFGFNQAKLEQLVIAELRSTRAISSSASIAERIAEFNLAVKAEPGVAIAVQGDTAFLDRLEKLTGLHIDVIPGKGRDSSPTLKAVGGLNAMGGNK